VRKDLGAKELLTEQHDKGANTEGIDRRRYTKAPRQCHIDRQPGKRAQD
jgi:hypothetical protein